MTYTRASPIDVATSMYSANEFLKQLSIYSLSCHSITKKTYVLRRKIIEERNNLIDRKMISLIENNR